jgi:hypothetical protein
MYNTEGVYMNYKKIYDQLIQNAVMRQQNTTLNFYTERHHIVPKCMGGSNISSNLVRLTAREHFIAHKLLYKYYKTTKLAHAWFSMLRYSDNQYRTFTARQYAEAKQAHVSALKTYAGNKNPFFGKTHTPQTKESIRLKKLGTRASEETKRKMSEKRIGVKKTKEHKEKIGRPGYVMLQNTETLQIVRIHKNNLVNYPSAKWVNPRKITPEKKYKCSHCDVVTSMGNLKRWHEDNCKQKGVK